MKTSTEQIILWSLGDLISPDILKYLIIVMLISFIGIYAALFFVVQSLWGIEFSLFGDSYSGSGLTAQLSAMLSHIPLIGGLLAWAAGFFIFILFIIIGSYFSVTIGLLIISFLTPYIINTILRRRYGHMVTVPGYGNFITSMAKLAQIILIHIVIFIIGIPLLFVPGINVLFSWVLPFSIFRSFLTYDVGTTLLAKSQYKQATAWQNGQLLLVSFLAYLLTLIPFVGLIAPLCGVILLTNYFYGNGDIHPLEETNIIDR